MQPEPVSPRRKVVRLLAIVLGFLALIGIALTIAALRFTPTVRARAIQILEDRYQSKVSLGPLSITLFPLVSIQGQDLEMRLHGRTDVPPTVAISKFTAHANLSIVFGRDLHITNLILEGLKLNLAPHPLEAPHAVNGETSVPDLHNLVIDRITADGTLLSILPKDPAKEPLDFVISRLSLSPVGVGRTMAFQAELTNPKPPGVIHSTGHFGPWHSGEPGATPVDGHYTFQDADLSVFHGIAGKLSSTGDYRGQLNNIEINGTTDTPDFLVTSGAHPVHLQTRFHAFVNGTDGNTYLQPVDATFLNTHLLCEGKVEGHPGETGKTVELKVRMDHGRIEDLLRLAVKGSPVMTGAARLHTSFLLPPGQAHVMERLALNGTFEVASAKFTKGDVQGKLANLSLRAQGHPPSPEGEDPGEEARVASNLQAAFVLSHGTARFSQIAFAVPGASVNLQGSYGLTDEKIQMQGLFRMNARVSQAFTGWKSVLLKFVDPLFATHGAGTELHILIVGPRDHPRFGVDLFGKKLFLPPR